MNATETAAFEAWQSQHAATFHLLMAHKYGAKDSAQIARDYLAQAVARLDAVLVAPADVEGAGV
jgi:hypothetical protein